MRACHLLRSPTRRLLALLSLTAVADCSTLCYSVPPPNLKTVEINLISVIHATSLAMYHFEQQRSQEKMTIEGGKPSLRRLVLTGSLASFFGAPSSPQYSVGQSAVRRMASRVEENDKLNS